LEMWFRRFIDGETTTDHCQRRDETMLATARI
jgi:hypothetical protein